MLVSTPAPIVGGETSVAVGTGVMTELSGLLVVVLIGPLTVVVRSTGLLVEGFPPSLVNPCGLDLMLVVVDSVLGEVVVDTALVGSPG